MADGMVNVLAATERELRQVEAEIARLNNQADALRSVKASIEQYLAITAPPVPDLSGASIVTTGAGVAAGLAAAVLDARRVVPMAGPRGKDAIRKLMETRPYHEWTIAELRDGLLERGWIEDNERVTKATNTNVVRAVQAWPEEIIRVTNGRYVYVPPAAVVDDGSTSEDDGAVHGNGTSAQQEAERVTARSDVPQVGDRTLYPALGQT